MTSGEKQQFFSQEKKIPQLLLLLFQRVYCILLQHSPHCSSAFPCFRISLVEICIRSCLSRKKFLHKFPAVLSVLPSSSKLSFNSFLFLLILFARFCSLKRLNLISILWKTYSINFLSWIPSEFQCFPLYFLAVSRVWMQFRVWSLSFSLLQWKGVCCVLLVCWGPLLLLVIAVPLSVVTLLAFRLEFLDRDFFEGRE